MPDSLSPDRVLAKNIAAMGTELGEIFTQLSQELTLAYWRWTQYTKLFGDNASRLEILNASAPDFFWIVQDVLWNETLLGISRIGGPAETGTKQNLSVLRVAALITDLKLRSDVEQLAVLVTDTGAFAIDWRNRHIAHRDLNLALGRQVKPLAGVSRNEVDAALHAMADLMNRVERHYGQSTTAYTSCFLTSDVDSLLSVLRDGLQLESLRQAKLERGEYDPNDWEYGPDGF